MAERKSHNLDDLPLPSGSRPIPSAGTIASGPPISEKARISLYSPADWEEFTLEWATTLRPRYTLVQRIGGTGDRGIDVAGFRSDEGFLGPWDLFQCKHYDRPLRPSDLFPEIFKVMEAVDEGVYQLPERYWIVAPKECGTALSLLLGNAPAHKSEFRRALSDRDTGLRAVGADADYDKVAEVAATTDFEIFTAENLLTVIEEHGSSRYHAARFGGGLGERPEAAPPPLVPRAVEHRYIQQLMAVYDEAHPPGGFTHRTALEHAGTARHYPRQREAFYSAEALREFSRDATLDGTYEALQEEIFDAVIEAHDDEKGSGKNRLRVIQDLAVAVSPTSNGLIGFVQARDKKGICHQLANADRLTWVTTDVSV